MEKPSYFVLLKRILLKALIAVGIFIIGYSVAALLNIENIISKNFKNTVSKSIVDKADYEQAQFNKSEYEFDRARTFGGNIIDDNPRFVEKDQKIYYRNYKYIEIIDADIESFEILGRGVTVSEDFFISKRCGDSCYSKDKNRVFFRTEVIPGADPETFIILPDYYSRDAQNVYYQEKLVSGTDADTFTVNNFKAKDKKNFYLGSEKISFFQFYQQKVRIIEIILAVILIPLFVCFLNYRFFQRSYIFNNFYDYLGILLPVFSFWILPLIFDPFFGNYRTSYFNLTLGDYILFLFFSIPLYISFFFIKKKKTFFKVAIFYFIPLYVIRIFLEGLGTLG